MPKSRELPRVRLTLEIREPGKAPFRFFCRAKSAETTEEAAHTLMKSLDSHLWQRMLEIDAGMDRP